MFEHRYMRRALELAELGRGNVAPNPMVGCVIVHEAKIIGEGYHKKYGEPHAEVNAINSVKDPALLKESTLYVTLEPCSHFGKTPPCADLIIKKNIRKVAIACRDPFEQVDGKGIERLQKAGIEVEVGMLEQEAKIQNARFFTFHSIKRPYVILKWAQTADGFLARTNGDSKWISNSHSRQLVHKWRSEEDAILVGQTTAEIDNPSLTTRQWVGKNPIRIVLDRKLQTPKNFKLFDDKATTYIMNTEREEEAGSNRWIKLSTMTPGAILEKLHELRIQSVIIEGGSAVLNSFIADDCWDEARVFQSEQLFGKGLKAPKLEETFIGKSSVRDDQLFTYRNQHG